jgi:hypothetical protein
MDLARHHRRSHPRLRPYNRLDACFEWPPVPASDRRGLHRDGAIRPLDHRDRLQTPRTVGLVRLMVLPTLLDVAPRRRVAARKRSRPPGRVHRTLARGPAPARARILPAKGNTGTHDLVKFPTLRELLTAGFSELDPHRMKHMRGLLKGSVRLAEVASSCGRVSIYATRCENTRICR